MALLTWLRSEWDRAGGYGLIALGGLAILIGYEGVATSKYVAEDLAYVVSGGIGGLFLVGIGATLLISADLHDEWRKLDEIAALLRGDDTGAGGAQVDVAALVTLLPALRAAMGSTNGVKDEAVDVAPADAQATQRAAARDRSAGSSLVGVIVAFAVGAMVIAGSWHAVATTSNPQAAMDATAVAVLGLFIVGGASAAFTLRHKRTLKQRQVGLLGPLGLALTLGSIAPAPALAPSDPWSGGSRGRRPRGGARADAVVVIDGLTRFHRPGCAAVAGLEVRSVSRARVDPALRPCALCRAEET